MILRLNQQRLNQELQSFLRGRLPGAVSQVVRRTALAIGGEIVRSLNGTEAGYFLPKRIDTGRYRAAWAMGVQDATGAALPAPRSTDPENPSLDSDGKGRTQRDSAGLRVVVRVDNNVEYAPFIEEGTDRMLPGKHVARALLVSAAELRAAAGKEIPAAWDGALRGKVRLDPGTI